jgi:hypothetical protein
MRKYQFGGMQALLQVDAFPRALLPVTKSNRAHVTIRASGARLLFVIPSTLLVKQGHASGNYIRSCDYVTQSLPPQHCMTLSCTKHRVEGKVEGPYKSHTEDRSRLSAPPIERLKQGFSRQGRHLVTA